MHTCQALPARSTLPTLIHPTSSHLDGCNLHQTPSHASALHLYLHLEYTYTSYALAPSIHASGIHPLTHLTHLTHSLTTHSLTRANHVIHSPCGSLPRSRPAQINSAGVPVLHPHRRHGWDVLRYVRVPTPFSNSQRDSDQPQPRLGLCHSLDRSEAGVVSCVTASPAPRLPGSWPLSDFSNPGSRVDPLLGFALGAMPENSCQQLPTSSHSLLTCSHKLP